MNKQINIGDEFQVEFISNRISGKPICRIKGFVAFIDSSDRTIVTPESIWCVQVTKVFQRFLTIKPLYQVKTANENRVEKAEMLKVFVKKTETKKQVLTSFSELQNV